MISPCPFLADSGREQLSQVGLRIDSSPSFEAAHESRRTAQLVEAYDQSTNEPGAVDLAIRAALMTVEPGLASEILQLFGTNDPAAK